jgi:hypothetical protein
MLRPEYIYTHVIQLVLLIFTHLLPDLNNRHLLIIWGGGQINMGTGWEYC